MRLLHGDCFELMNEIGEVDHAIFDPPYSAEVHSKKRAQRVPLKSGDGKIRRCDISRTVDFGFDPIDVAWMERMSDALFDRVRRWVLVFCDVESSHLWRGALTSAGFDYCRTGAWIKIGGSPQFTGDRPGAGFESIAIAHKPGRKRWNGGGSLGVWSHHICIDDNRRTRNDERVHPTQKPLSLMLELASLFSDPGETILDPTMGSGTTGVAAVRLGRDFIGIERMPEHFASARLRIEAEAAGSDSRAVRAGQLAMFGGG